MPNDEKRVLEGFRSLPEQARRSLLDYMDYLIQRHAVSPPSQQIAPPLEIERPAQETVIGAIKRLSQMYPMLDRSKLLDETSQLVSQHVLQGRHAAQVIDELEVRFRTHYQSLVQATNEAGGSKKEEDK